MSQELAPIKRELPVLSELYEITNIDTMFKHDQFNLLMNQEPDPKWLAINKYAGNSRYIPIGIQETLLQRVFKDHRIEILREGTMFNAIYVTIRLHFLHPVTGEWSFHDGTGADQIQTKAGASASDLSSISNNAVQMSLPKAVSYAISDATDHLGKLWGRDLNRDKEKTMGFGVDKNLDTESKHQILSDLFETKKDIIPADEFDNITRIVTNKEKTSYDKAIKYLKTLNFE